MFQNLQSFRILDKKSQAEIISLLSTLDQTKITPTNVHLVLKFALRIILFDDSVSLVQLCWKILEYIPTLNVPFETLISPQFLEDVLSDETLQDCPDVLKIVYWVLNNTESEELRMAVKQKVVEIVGPKGSGVHKNLDDLNKIIQKINLFRSQAEIMPQGPQLVELCKNLVLSLGKFQMPNEASAIGIFVKNVEEIRDFLQTISEASPKDVKIALLNALYMSISESHGTAGPGLAVVLQLIDPNFITDAVRWILGPKHDDISLIRGLNVLCDWLFQWTRNPQLGRWVIAFMQGLRTQKRFCVLEQVAVAKTRKMCQMLLLPLYRTSVSSVLFHILCSMQHTPTAFLIAVEQFPDIIIGLRHQDSDSSRVCLQAIVDVCMVLMEHFPEHESSYELLRDALRDERPSEDYRIHLHVPVWSDGSELCPTSHNVPGKVGLINLGNTCYMNSVLQALFMTHTFRNEILMYPYSVGTINSVQTLFALLQHSTRSAMPPPDSLLRVRPPGFIPGLQHDSSEYMGYLLDLLHEQEKSQLTSRYPNNEGAECTPGTVVQRTFGGQASTTYRCDTCGGESTQSDSFRDIQLSFPVNSNRDNSVQALLEFYLEPEQLCGENKYWCERCSGLNDAERLFRVTQPPRHLILTLKHFRYDPKSQQRAKLFQRVLYDPVINLDSSRYDLYAAVVHSGPSVDSGHYYTFAKDTLSVWYKFNDSWVNRSSLGELSALQQPSTPYVLFYQKQDVVPSAPLSLDTLNQNLQTEVTRDQSEHTAENARLSQRSASPILRTTDDEEPRSGSAQDDYSDNTVCRYVC